MSFDLEDAVVSEKKREAREAVASYLRSRAAGRDKIVIVRVNDPSTELFQHDIDAVVGCGLDIVNLPKVESREDILNAVKAIERTESSCGVGTAIGILATIETPKGLRLAAEIATADSRVIGLQIGFSDFASCCGIEGREDSALQAVRVGVRFAAAEAGVAAFDGAFPDVKNTEAYRADAESARRLGFSGKSCIHPSQVPIANEVFSPRPEDIALARSVVAAAEAAAERGIGAIVLDGRMIDKPIVAQAREVLALAARLEKVSSQ